MMFMKIRKPGAPDRIITFFLTTAVILLITASLSAATLILTNGAAVKGRLVNSTDAAIVIQDPNTRQIRTIKKVFIREIILDPDEKEMAAKAGGTGLKGASRSSAETIRHLVFALSAGGCKIIDGPGPGLNFGFGGSLIFQYNYLVSGLGLDLHASYFYNPDKEYTASNVTILPVIVSPQFRFHTRYIDMDLRAGAGISSTMSTSGSRLKLIPSGDPGQPVSAILVKSSQGRSIDLVAGAGAAVSHTFGMGLVLGFEVNYYYIFQTLSADAASASIYCGYAF
jgi:hypothetical protein